MSYSQICFKMVTDQWEGHRGNLNVVHQEPIIYRLLNASDNSGPLKYRKFNIGLVNLNTAIFSRPPEKVFIPPLKAPKWEQNKNPGGTPI